MLSKSLNLAQNCGQINGLAGGSSSPVTQYGWKQKIPAATKSTSFLHLATIGYLSIAVHGILADEKLFSAPYHASAYVIFLPFPYPLPMKVYSPSQFESPHVIYLSVCLQKFSLHFGQLDLVNPRLAKVLTG